MSSATLRLALASEKMKALEAANTALRKQLGETVATLARARAPRRRLNLPAPPKRKARLKGDRIRFGVPDTHGMRVSKKAFAAVIADIKALAPHEIILLGDHLDCGGFLAQHHTLGYVAETSYSYEEDCGAANAQLDSIQNAAPSAVIDYLEGNHERRVETWCVTQTLRHQRDSEMLRRAFAPEYVLRLAERGVNYRKISVCYDGLDIPGVIQRGNCYFMHGITTAKHAAFVTRMRTAGNCVHGHTHRAQSDIGRMLNVGIVGVWSPGCLCELQPLWMHGAPTDWTHGHCVQFVSRTGKFLHLNVPVIDGVSLFCSLLNQ
jgi:hypothetical protein